MRDLVAFIKEMGGLNPDTVCPERDGNFYEIISDHCRTIATPICEPLFWEGNFGYRPGRSAQDAIRKVKKYAEKGYTQAVLVDLSKYFNTLNHELLMNFLRKNIHNERVIELIKCLHARLTRLLRNCKHNDNITGMGWLATPSIPVLYLETVEETKEAGEEPDSAGNSRMASMDGEQLPKGLLAHGKEWPCPKGHLNGKARTARIQEYPRTVRACTYAIEPPYTERYVRWCERSARYLASYSILPSIPLSAMRPTAHLHRKQSARSPCKAR